MRLQTNPAFNTHYYLTAGVSKLSRLISRDLPGVPSVYTIHRMLRVILWVSQVGVQQMNSSRNSTRSICSDNDKESSYRCNQQPQTTAQKRPSGVLNYRLGRAASQRLVQCYLLSRWQPVATPSRRGTATIGLPLAHRPTIPRYLIAHCGR